MGNTKGRALLDAAEEWLFDQGTQEVLVAERPAVGASLRGQRTPTFPLCLCVSVCLCVCLSLCLSLSRSRSLSLSLSPSLSLPLALW